MMFILISILAINFAFAGTSNYKDLYEIKDTSFERTDYLRTFEAFRYRYDGTLCVIGIDSIKTDKVNFFSKCDGFNYYESFTLLEYDKNFLDINLDNNIDISLTLDDIVYENGKKRIQLTFSTKEDDYLSNHILTKTNTEKEISEPIQKIENIKQKIVEVTQETTIEEDVETVTVITKEPTKVVIAEPVNKDLELENNIYRKIDQEKEAEQSQPMDADTFALIVWLIVLLIVSGGLSIFFAIYKKKHKYFY